MKKLSALFLLIALFGFSGTSLAGVEGNPDDGGGMEGPGNGNGIPSVPEPAAWLLLGAGVAGLVAARKMK